MGAVLETKRSRGWVIAGVVAAGLVVGLVTATVGDRRIDAQTDALVEAAREQLEDVDPATVPDLVTEDLVDTYEGDESELGALLVLDGREPNLVTFEGGGFVARYDLETWGRQATVVVQGSADGFEVTTE
jgi:hypothetical protein